MVEWLLSNDHLKPYRHRLLTATATGDFFKMYVYTLFVFYLLIAFLEDNHLIMVKLHLDLLVVLINGILLKFYSNMVLIWIRLV